MSIKGSGRIRVAQFMAVCRSVKTSRTCENLPPVAEPVSRYQEILSHAGALIRPPTLQRQTVPSVHPLIQCPRCQSHNIGRWGKYQCRPGCKRSWCHGCKRTFNDLTDTLLHQSKRPLSYWILATFLLCLSCSSRRIARELGAHIRTSDRWCGWLRNAALSYEMER